MTRPLRITTRPRGRITREGRSVTIEFASSNDPTTRGSMFIRMTEQMTKNGEGLVPHKMCSRCRHSFPAVAFIHTQILRSDGYSILTDGPWCHRCVKVPPDLRFHFDKWGRLAMRLDLHDENGDAIRMFDQKQKIWYALIDCGLRLMTDSNEIRLQPYKDRQHHKDGFTYGRGPRLPLGDL